MARLDNLDYEENGVITNYEIVPEIAPLFNTTTAYAAGDTVIKEGHLYRFNTAHAAGAWIGTDADEITVGEELTSHGADITELKADLSEAQTALETKAEIDGSYDTMTVGNAKQLTSSVGINDKAPYLFRTAGGANNIGDREEDTIVGGSVVWNQLEPLDASKYTIYNSSIFSLSLSNGVYQALVKSDTNNYKTARLAAITPGHKYYASYDGACHSANQGLQVIIADNSGSLTSNPVALPSIAKNTPDFVHYASIVAAGETNTVFGFKFAGGTPKDDYAEIKNIIICDLTLMFGATIADYVHSLETATAGSGIAWLKKYGFFTKDYYEYCAPTLKHVSGLLSHSMVGFNAYDNTTGKVKVVGGQQYQITGAYTDLSLDGEAVTPDASGYFTPANGGELTVTGGNGTTTCVHLVWDGERDGEYEAYNVNSYTLDASLTLCGIPKLDTGNNLYYDGDTYEADGTVKRRYRVVDLGEITWTTAYTGDVNKTMRTDVLGKGYDRTKKIKGICDSYNIVDYVSAAIYVDAPDEKEIGIYSYRQPSGTSRTIYLVIPKDSTPSGHLVYEVATPTTETADPYQTPQIVDDWGTEEYVCTPDSDGVVIPVGHDTFYSANLKAKLEMSPDSPGDGDGDYIVRQTNGLNEYAKLVIPNELPTSPSEDGTYTLKVTVADGTATLVWVADT